MSKRKHHYQQVRARISQQVELRNLFHDFFHSQFIGGILLLICAIAALCFANIPKLNFLNDLWQLPASISIGGHTLEMSLLHWVNEGLMAIFFFMVGLEIKREILVGELSTVKQAAFPIFSAIGGMLVPALFFLLFNHGTETANGWGIPMATDIAFAIGVLSLIGKRVPLGLKVFLTALAIVDDLGAILVLVFFYPTHAIHPELLLAAGGVVALLVLFNRLRVYHPAFYLIPGVILWLIILGSGIHTTLAGVLLAATIPAHTSMNEVRFVVRMRYLIERFKNAGHHQLKVLANPEQQQIIHRIHSKVRIINPLMNRFESGLHPWVTFLIMPVFALANAGVVLDSRLFGALSSPLSMGIISGLVLGKPIGIFLFGWLACKCHLAKLPTGIRWKQIAATGAVAGIGFTMSIFIDNLAFSDPYLVDTGKVSILVGSFIAGMIGIIALRIASKLK